MRRAVPLSIMCLFVVSSFCAASPVPFDFNYIDSSVSAQTYVAMHYDGAWHSATDINSGQLDAYVCSYMEDPTGQYFAMTETSVSMSYMDTDDNIGISYNETFLASNNKFADHEGYTLSGFHGTLEVGTSVFFPTGSAGLILEILPYIDFLNLQDIGGYVQFFSNSLSNPINVTLGWADAGTLTTIPVLAGQDVEFHFISDWNVFGDCTTTGGYFDFDLDMNIVPEPCTIFILGAGGVFLLRKKK